MSIHGVYDLVAMGLRSDFISTKSILVLTFRNVSRTPWDGLTHPLGVHAPQLGNPCLKVNHKRGDLNQPMFSTDLMAATLIAQYHDLGQNALSKE